MRTRGIHQADRGKRCERRASCPRQGGTFVGDDELVDAMTAIYIEELLADEEPPSNDELIQARLRIQSLARGLNT